MHLSKLNQLLLASLVVLSGGGLLNYPGITLSGAKVHAQSTQDDNKTADQLLQQGRQQAKTSQFRAALQSWEQSLKLYRQIGNRLGEAKSLNNLGIAYYSLGQYQKAISFLQQTLDISREIGNREIEANALGNLGSAY
ncbi:tetratricopeptide repeat protein, partial [Acaryochloris marina NIES-2412]|uniref:tetratricopeptide repeat protein n=1 Tax=Acaryochloris marina TaxID=155978 RepID=UPI004058CD31